MSNRRYDLPRQNAGESISYIVDSPSELEFVYTPDAKASGDPLNARLLYVTSAKYEGDWESLYHSHGFSELFLVLGGRGQFLAGGERYDVGPNDLVIINPQVEHAEYSMASAPLEYVVLGIDGLQFFSRDNALSAFSVIRLPGASSRIRLYIEQLLREVQEKHYGREAICQYLLNIILVLILGYQKVDISITAARNISAECAAVKNYIDNHFREPITLEDLAEAAHQNKYYVAHMFKDAFGISPIRYLTERRVEESRYLLTDTSYVISEIAAITGFSSSSVFSQTFRRIVGMSPNEFRRLGKTEKNGK